MHEQLGTASDSYPGTHLLKCSEIGFDILQELQENELIIKLFLKLEILLKTCFGL